MNIASDGADVELMVATTHLGSHDQTSQDAHSSSSEIYLCHIELSLGQRPYQGGRRCPGRSCSRWHWQRRDNIAPVNYVHDVGTFSAVDDDGTIFAAVRLPVVVSLR